MNGISVYTSRNYVVSLFPFPFSPLSYSPLYVALNLPRRYSSAVIPCTPSPLDVPLSNPALLTLSLGTVSSTVVPTGCAKYAILYLSPPPSPGKTTRWTVLRSKPFVHAESRSPMFTNTGGATSPSVPGGWMGTGVKAMDDEGGSISKPGWPGRRKRRVREP